MARRENAVISGILRVFATQPGGMHRRLKCEVIFERALNTIARQKSHKENNINSLSLNRRKNNG